MSWTDERVETLKKMWGEGQSASQIAKELGGVTRNAVIGKVHRLGLSNRAGTAPGPAATPTVPPGGVGGGMGMASANRTAPRPAPMDDDAALVDVELIDEVEAETAMPVDDDLPEVEIADDDEDDLAPVSPLRRAIIPAGQPLPPQPSLNEISPEALAKVSEVEKTARKLTLMELTEKTCKWPVGDPATDNFWFCGLPVQQGKPYCEAHVGVAFQPMSARRDRRR
jgi:GcrA cell cycle regulator